MLEHIPDDAKALSELYRILKPGGFGLLLVLICLSIEVSDEDPDASETERGRRFGQSNRVRNYARNDFIARVENAGFHLLQLGQDWFGHACFSKLGVSDSTVLYVVKKEEKQD